MLLYCGLISYNHSLSWFQKQPEQKTPPQAKTLSATPSGILMRFKVSFQTIKTIYFPQKNSSRSISCEFSWHLVSFLSHVHYASHQCLVLSQEYLQLPSVQKRVDGKMVTSTLKSITTNQEESNDTLRFQILELFVCSNRPSSNKSMQKYVQSTWKVITNKNTYFSHFINKYIWENVCQV